MKTAIQFEDENGIVHLYKTDKGLHYRTYPTDNQFVIEVLDENGNIFARTETKLEYENPEDIEILEERDFFYTWNEEIPESIVDFLADKEVDGEVRFNLNCVEDFLTEIIQYNIDTILKVINDLYERTR